MMQSKLNPKLKPIKIYEKKSLNGIENICLTCTLDECNNPGRCKRFKEEKDKLLRSSTGIDDKRDKKMSRFRRKRKEILIS